MDDTLGIINIGLFILLITVTLYYAIQTRRLVRVDPKPFVYISDPDDHEWKKDVEKVETDERPKAIYLRVKSLLVNPGITPMTLTSFNETFTNSKDEIVDIKGRFIEPKISSSERHGLYIFCIPWVIIHDDFSIWYRVYEIDDKISKDEEYRLNLTYS
ncbi:hypothetical protein KA005_50595, partial [bacterium]|nr:hypothetical protein [bacterium]